MIVENPYSLDSRSRIYNARPVRAFFLGGGMVLILEANNREEFISNLASLNIAVEPRSSGRTSQQTERYCVAHVLATLPPDRLTFPMTLMHVDRPDFRLVMSNVCIGIEHTEAVALNIVREDAIRQKNGLRADTRSFRRAGAGERRKSADELRREIESPDSGETWRGDEPEREWTQAMAWFIEEKKKKAKNGGFTRFQSNWLVIYDNWELPCVDYAEAAPKLRSI